MARSVEEDFQRMVGNAMTELFDSMQTRIDRSGELSDTDESIVASIMEMANEQRFEPLREYVRALSDNGLYTLLRMMKHTTLCVQNEVIGRLVQEREATKKK